MKRDIQNFSVSQVETFGMESVEIFGEPGEPGCPRKHFFSWILGMKPPATDAQKRGSDLHKSIENWLISKTPPPKEHEIYLNAIEPYFPRFDYSVEHKLVLDTHLSIPWIGYIDLVCEDPEQTTLIDWKSTSDMRYARTPDELRRNLQLNVYAHYAYELGVEHDVRAGMVYVEVPKTPPKKKAKVLPVFIDISREQAAHVWDATKPVLDRMLEISLLDDPQDVPCNTALCGKYGGCPFRAECGISMFSSVAASGSHTPAKHKESSLMSQPSFLDRLKSKSNGHAAAPPPPPAPETPQAASEASAAPKAGGSFLSRKAGAQAPSAGVQTPTAGAQAASAPAVGVVPPDAPPRDSGGADPLEPEVALGDGEEAEVKADAPAPEAPKRRGRPPKAAEKPAEVQAEKPAEVQTAKPAPAAQARKTFVLYVDCIVVKGRGEIEPTDFSDWCGQIEMELNELALEEEKLPHWMLLGFGPQKAALALKVQEKISQGLPPAMLVTSSSSMAREILPMLLPHATTVIRALRG